MTGRKTTQAPPFWLYIIVISLLGAQVAYVATAWLPDPWKTRAFVGALLIVGVCGGLLYLKLWPENGDTT